MSKENYIDPADLLEKLNTEWTPYSLEENSKSEIQIKQVLIQNETNDFSKTIIDDDEEIKRIYSNKVYSIHSSDIKNVLKRINEKRYDLSKWRMYKENKNLIGLYGFPQVDSLLNLFLDKSISEELSYWVEYDLYNYVDSNILSNNLESETLELKIIKYISKNYFVKRTEQEIENANITEDDYLKWCLQVWKDIFVDYQRREDNRQEQK